MELSSKQKMYVSILGLCLGCLAVDRVFLGPSEASAQDGDGVSSYAVPRSAVDAAAATPAEMVAEEDPAQGERIFARRLASVAEERGLDLDHVVDAFAPSAAWPTLDGDTTDAPLTVGSPAYRFRNEHRLTAVMAGRSGGYAIVDGKGLSIGASIGGFTLLSVGEASAVFEADGVRVELIVGRGDRGSN